MYFEVSKTGQIKKAYEGKFYDYQSHDINRPIQLFEGNKGAEQGLYKTILLDDNTMKECLRRMT